MSDAPAVPAPLRLQSRSGLRVEVNSNGSLRRMDCDSTTLSLFVGNEVEGGTTNLYLRRFTGAAAAPIQWTPLLGPRSPTRFSIDWSNGSLRGAGTWNGIDYWISLLLAAGSPAWFWHVRLANAATVQQCVDLTYTQDVALASYAGIRLNEFYVSQYIDHTALTHPSQGVVIASRQNLAVGGRHPWCMLGSLHKTISFATDALQFHGLASRRGDTPPGLSADLPSQRLQHEHSMAALRDAAIALEPGESFAAGFFGLYQADHPQATSDSDLARVAGVLALPEAAASAGTTGDAGSGEETQSLTKPDEPAFNPSSLFSAAPLLAALDLDAGSLRQLFGSDWRHVELDQSQRPLSFFHGADRHVVLRSKELVVLRPHGQLLRTGRHLTPDESALTSTAWMNGVFHSMVSQGHVSINRFLSTVHSYLGLFRSHGLRVFVLRDGNWQLLDMPSAFEMSPDSCRWFYLHSGGLIEVRSGASDASQADGNDGATGAPDHWHCAHQLTLSIKVTAGVPAQFLISLHIALNGDDGNAPDPAHWTRSGHTIEVMPSPQSEIGNRFPGGRFEISPLGGTEFAQVGGDELLFADGSSRGQPYLCLVTAPAQSLDLSIRGHLVEAPQSPQIAASGAQLIPHLGLQAGLTSLPSAPLARLAEIVPWFAQNAFVHYLAPRGLEQYSGGGWGTRDVCQGPVEMLLALGHVAPIRDLLLRVMGTQNPDGDWPQWFMFFERERNIRPADAHGDIVLWPVLVLAQYLTASGDAAILDEPVSFFDPRGSDSGERATVWEHLQRALAVIRKRVIPGTSLAAYGHGDWNDSLQPADPALRERMCSAWTVTLHVQSLEALARALGSIGRLPEGARLTEWSHAIRRDFQRWLVVDGVLCGYAHFEDTGRVRYLLHPRDKATGVQLSSLAMIHAILEDMLTPAQTRHHLKLIDQHLSGPDGVRLFDRPMRYHGGPERLFQRAESAAFFGREIGLMYTHAHLRYAQALAHVGEAEGFFHALCQANPIGIRDIVATATPRQANCYYSSSDAAFADRYQASSQYTRVAAGTVPLEGGWRVYSSGAGIALALIIRRFLGLSCEATSLRIDPVIPAKYDGMKVALTLLGRPFEVHYRIGSRGCGVDAIALNGSALDFARESNPHRCGAALVPMVAVRAALLDAPNFLTIELGGS